MGSWTKKKDRMKENQRLEQSNHQRVFKKIIYAVTESNHLPFRKIKILLSVVVNTDNLQCSKLKPNFLS